MPSKSVTIRLDENLKNQVETLFNDMGLNMTTAFTIFAKAVVRQKKIPFEITADPAHGESTQHLKHKSTEINNDFAYSMTKAAKDISFMERTLTCQDDFKYIDGEVMGKW